MFHSLPITSTWHVHGFVTKLFSKENTYNIISIIIIKVDSFKYSFFKIVNVYNFYHDIFEY